jgi:predicted TIM-barrel fold metal-dependent hydrolase
MSLAKNTVGRREFLAQAAAGLVNESKRLIIDTHLEVWTIDPKFPFRHPEEKPDISAPIENEVEEIREYGLRYAVLINPRDHGWDNSYISYSLHKYPESVRGARADQPRKSQSRGSAALLGEGTRFSGHAV